MSEMTWVERGHFAGTFQSGSRHNDVVISNHFAGSLEFGPNPRMFVRSLLRVRDDWQ